MKLYEQKENVKVAASADSLETFLSLVKAKDIQNPEAAARNLPVEVMQALLSFGPKDIEAAIAEARKADAHLVFLEKTTEKAPAPKKAAAESAKPATTHYKPATPTK